jgi:hypothetical protein
MQRQGLHEPALEQKRLRPKHAGQEASRKLEKPHSSSHILPDVKPRACKTLISHV